MAKDRGAEQGDVDGPLECGLTLGVVARETRSALHDAQEQGSIPWMRADTVGIREAKDSRVDMQTRKDKHRERRPAERRT